MSFSRCSRVAKDFVIGIVLQSQDFIMAVNMKEAMQRIMYQNWRKKVTETKQHPKSQGLALKLHRPNDHVWRRLY